MLVRTEEQLNTLVDRLMAAPWLAFDTETQGLNLYSERHKVIGLSFGIPCKDGVDTYYAAFRHERGGRLNLPEKLIHAFEPVFQDPQKKLVGWNTKFDCHALWQDKIEVTATVLDAMLAWHLIDESLPKNSLKYVAALKIGKEEVADDKDLADLLKSEKLDKGKMYLLSPIEAKDYAESDADLSWRLFTMAVPKLKAEGTIDLFYEICDYARVIEKAERKGLKIDPKLCEELIMDAEIRDGDLLALLKSLAGQDFNPKSHPQCRQWLGIASTAKDVLIELEGVVPGVTELLEYRGHEKALSAFYRPFQSRQDRFNRVHASYNIHGTVTGRLSCQDPNTMCIPRTSSQWAKVKRMIIAPTGCVLLSTDLNQAEFRLMAHYVQDQQLLQDYNTGIADAHQLTADMLGISRQDAKTYNFALIYGGGVNTISKQLRCTLEEAQELLDRFHRQMPNLRKWAWQVRNYAETWGYVTMWSGRRRHFPIQNGMRYKTHTAPNSIIQGGVAEIVRIAMTGLGPTLPEDCFMLGQVHDEILVECPSRRLEEVAHMVKYALETVYTFRVPIKADQKWGRNWENMKSLE